MIGSDWPVCTLSANYAETVGIVFDFVQQLTNTEREGILGGNCVHIYPIA